MTRCRPRDVPSAIEHSGAHHFVTHALRAALLLAVACTSPGPAPSGDRGGPFSTDRRDFFGGSRCDTSLAFCEDFESGSLERYEMLGDNVTVDATHAARGARALHVRAQGSLDVELIRTRAPFPLPANSHYLRMFVYFAALPAPPMDVNGWSLAWAQTEPSEAQYTRLGGQFDGTNNFFATGSAEPAITLVDADPAASPRPVPTGEWLCLEWRNDGTRHEQHFYWDAVEHPSLTITASTPSPINPTVPYVAPRVDFVDIGWIGTVNEPVDVWIDEIAIDEQRIGCAR